MKNLTLTLLVLASLISITTFRILDSTNQLVNLIELVAYVSLVAAWLGYLGYDDDPKLPPFA